MVKGRPSGYTKEEALKRTYEVKEMSQGACVFLPKCLRGLKVKIKEIN